MNLCLYRQFNINSIRSLRNQKIEIMKIRKNIAISDSGFIFNPSTGDSFSVNPIGLEIIKLLKEEKSGDDIKKHLLKTYSVDESTVEKDYYDFLKMLEANKLNAENEKVN